jgi:ferredoxin
MPANPEEVEASFEEGIRIEYLTSITKIMQENGELLVECIRGRLGEPDAKGRRSPYPIKGTEFIRAYDTVIVAIGQRPVIPKGFNLKIRKNDYIDAIHDTLETNREGVYAGGDAQTGPASVIEAIAAGRQGAISIDKYLGGKGIIDEELVPRSDIQPQLNRIDKNIHRVHPGTMEVEERLKDFIEVEQPLTYEVAVKEANRCLKCDLAYTVDKMEADMGYCIFCGLCVEACPRNSLFLSYDYEKARYRREELILDKNKLVLDDKTLKVRSGFCRPKEGAELPKQTLLLDRDKIK